MKRRLGGDDTKTSGRTEFGGVLAGSGSMATALYIVIQSRDKWWVDFEGRSHGPYETRENAALEARSLAQKADHKGRISEVLVPDADGKFWVVWSSNVTGAMTPRPVSRPTRNAA